MRSTIGPQGSCPRCGQGFDIEVRESGLVKVVNHLNDEDDLLMNIWKTKHFVLVIWTRANGIVDAVEIKLQPMSEWTLRRSGKSLVAQYQVAAADEAMVMERERRPMQLPLSQGNVF